MKSAIRITLVFSLTVVAMVFTAIADDSLSKFKYRSGDEEQSLNRGTENLTDGNYVVVGVFRYLKNAVKYSDYVASKGYQTKYGLREDRNFYYVYLFHSEVWEEAVERIQKVRQDEELREAWVLRIHNNQVVTGDQLEEEFDDFEEEQVAGVAPEIIQPATPTPEVEEEPAVEEPTGNDSNFKDKGDVKGDYFLFVNTFREKDRKKVEASVELVDNVRAKLIKRLESNTLEGVYDPRNGKSTISLICNVFGYRKIEQHIKLKEPVNDSTMAFVKIKDEVINVDLPLVRLKEGDIAIMYNVYFFNDAAIMRPESKYEVNSLLEMLQENENMKIRIHGHTNSGKAGKIIRLKEGQNNFFSMSTDNEEGVGTAKDLSNERSEVIKRYLMDEGIAENRLETKGWGGKKMIYDKDSPQAKKNIRVEIEIIQD